jgi:hypothetical protein
VKNSPNIFFVKISINLTWNRGKSIPKIYATSVIFKALPKVNSRPVCEKSPNPVTLLPSLGWALSHTLTFWVAS